VSIAAHEATEAPKGSHRREISGLHSPFPLLQTLPAMFADDEFVQRFTEALDGVLAPVINSIDCWAAYLDARTTPQDFLRYLAGWTGVDLSGEWDLDGQRQVMLTGPERARWRGTAQALELALHLAGAKDVTIADGGGVHVSAVPTHAEDWQRDEAGPFVRVTVSADPDSVGLEQRVYRITRSLVAPQCRVDVVVAGA
jgi:phage tail-like protein